MDHDFIIQRNVVAQELQDLEAATAGLPALEFPQWHDSASVAYAIHLLHLRCQAESLLDTLRHACHHVQQAAVTMAGR